MLWCLPTKKLLEPVPIPDDFCTALAAIEEVGPCARFVLVTPHTVYEAGQQAFVVQRKIMLPLDAIMPGIEMATLFLSRRARGVVTDVVKAGVSRLS